MNQERAKALRYKRSALSTMGYDEITRELDEISEACDDIRWAFDDEDVTQAVMDGEDDDIGYRMEFSELSALVDRLREQLYAIEPQDYDDCTVALIGNRFSLVGFDGYEEDYFSLCSYESELATTEAGKRLMRHTKAEIISQIGQSVGLMMAFYDLRQRFDYIQAALGVLVDKNLETLHMIRGIEEAYSKWDENGCRQYGPELRQLQTLTEAMPEKYWVM